MVFSSLRLFAPRSVPFARPSGWLSAPAAALFGLALWFAPFHSAEAAEDAVNACGCGRDLTGSCVCQKVARCGCPGECEPKGCEEKRAKQLEKEIMAETRRAAEADRKRNAVTPAHDGDIDEGKHAKTTEPARAKSAARFEAAGAAARAPRSGRMTQSQKRELAQLLEAYLAENPERRARTIEQLRGDLE